MICWVEELSIRLDKPSGELKSTGQHVVYSQAEACRWLECGQEMHMSTALLDGTFAVPAAMTITQASHS